MKLIPISTAKALLSDMMGKEANRLSLDPTSILQLAEKYLSRKVGREPLNGWQDFEYDRTDWGEDAFQSIFLDDHSWGALDHLVLITDEGLASKEAVTFSIETLPQLFSEYPQHFQAELMQPADMLLLNVTKK